MKIIYNFSFFLYPQILLLSKIYLPHRSFQPYFPTKLLLPSLLIESFHGYSISIAEKPCFPYPKHVPPRIFRPLVVVPIPATPKTRLWTKVHAHTHTHTHIWHKIFRLSSRPSSSMSSRGGEGRVIPWYLSPLPPGAWPKSNVVKIEIIRATTFHPVTGFTPPRYLTRTILNVRSR